MKIQTVELGMNGCELGVAKLKKRGFKIIRNKRYTGDGGIDGRAYKNDQHYLIQAKRYRKHINPAHVTEFAEICKRRKGKGLFSIQAAQGQ